MQINDSTVAVVTGGASGLGEATTRRLHASGATVVIMDLTSSPGAALAAELGDLARFCAGDVRSQAQVQAAIDAARARRPASGRQLCGCRHARAGHRQERADGPRSFPQRR